MAHKKTNFILITVFIFMALVISGCRQAYPSADESLATPLAEGDSNFPEEIDAENMDEIQNDQHQVDDAIAFQQEDATLHRGSCLGLVSGFFRGDLLFHGFKLSPAAPS